MRQQRDKGGHKIGKIGWHSFWMMKNIASWSDLALLCYVFVLQIKSVKWVQVHENYNADFQHDVAIVRLDFRKKSSTNELTNGLKYVSNYVEPACLPKGKKLWMRMRRMYLLSKMQLFVKLQFLGNCDLEEINVVIKNHPNPNDIDLEITDINGVYKKQDYKINGKPWYKHSKEASKNGTCRHLEF